MIRGALILIFVIFFSCKMKKVARIEVYKVDFDIETFIKVDCENFNKYFNSQIDTVIVSDKKNIAHFSNLLQGLTPDSSNYTPDVRAKIVIVYDDASTETLCLSKLGVLLNNESFLGENNLVNFVESQEDKNVPEN